MKKYKHILVAVDLLPGYEEVIARALNLAKDNDAIISLVHVVEPLPGYGYAFISPADIENQLLDEAKVQMKAMAKKHKIDEKHVHVLLGPTKMEIIDAAENEKADLIVVGSHSRTGLGYLLGSTANAVIHSSPCDVLTVRIMDSK